jgi:hypothetical protein
MSYTLDVAPDAGRALRALDVDAQEAIFDLLDQLAGEGDQLTPGGQEHFVHLFLPEGFTTAFLWLFVDPDRRMLQLVALRAVTGRFP